MVRYLQLIVDGVNIDTAKYLDEREFPKEGEEFTPFCSSTHDVRYFAKKITLKYKTEHYESYNCECEPRIKEFYGPPKPEREFDHDAIALTYKRMIK